VWLEGLDQLKNQITSSGIEHKKIEKKQKRGADRNPQNDIKCYKHYSHAAANCVPVPWNRFQF
jgi:hypothetical protein